MAQILTDLIRKGTPLAFNDAVRELRDAEQPIPSFEGATFSELDLTGFTFQGIDFTNVEFENCTFAETVFENCLLNGALFHSSTLLQCQFVNLRAEGLAIDGCTLSRCRLASLVMDDCEWSDSQFNDCQLEQLCGEDILLERLTFRGGNWTEVYFSSGSCNYLTLRSLVFTGVDLSKLDVSHSYYLDVTTSTSLPDGFLEKTGRRKTL